MSCDLVEIRLDNHYIPISAQRCHQVAAEFRSFLLYFLTAALYAFWIDWSSLVGVNELV